MAPFIRIVVALVLLGWGVFAYSAEFYWYRTSSTFKFASPQAACDYFGRSTPPLSWRPSDTYVSKVATMLSSGNAQCRIASQPSDTNIDTFILYRSGECSGSYNSSTGVCTPPPEPDPEPEPSACASKSGDSFGFFAPVPGGGASLPGEYVCDSGCRATWSGECGANSEGASACWGLAVYTGGECQTGDAPTGIGQPPVDPTDPPDPTDPSNNCGPGHSWSGTTCVPTDPTNPTDPTDPTDPTEPGDGDGGDDGDTGGGNNGGGSDGDSSGNGDGSGDGDGDGNGGNGDGEGTDDEGDDKESSVSGESCTSDLVCEGDVIQCAILRKNKEQVCQWKYDSEVKAQIESTLSGPEYQLEEHDIAVSGLFSEAVNQGRWLPQSCPAPQTFTVMGRSYSFSWEPACRFALAIGPLIVALASIFFAVTISRGIKGS